LQWLMHRALGTYLLLSSMPLSVVAVVLILYAETSCGAYEGFKGTGGGGPLTARETAPAIGPTKLPTIWPDLRTYRSEAGAGSK